MHATRDTLPLRARARPDVVVADILTLAPALAAELRGVPCATLIPHVYPHGERDFPVYSLGARLPRSAARPRVVAPRPARVRPRARARARRELNGTRAQLGLPPLEHVHGGISRRLALVATFPSSSTRAPGRPRPRRRAADVGAARRRCRAAARRAAARAGRALDRAGPRAPLLRAALAGSPAPPCACSRPGTGACLRAPLPVPDNARVVDWVSYSRTMPLCDVVVCHAGHGTLVRALASGCAVVACPAVGDMNENAARARLGRRRRAPAPALRLAAPAATGGRARARRAGIRERARELGRWCAAHDAGERAALLIEELARSGAGVAETA